MYKVPDANSALTVVLYMILGNLGVYTLLFRILRCLLFSPITLKSFAASFGPAGLKKL